MNPMCVASAFANGTLRSEKKTSLRELTPSSLCHRSVGHASTRTEQWTRKPQQPLREQPRCSSGMSISMTLCHRLHAAAISLSRSSRGEEQLQSPAATASSSQYLDAGSRAPMQIRSVIRRRLLSSRASQSCRQRRCSTCRRRCRRRHVQAGARRHRFLQGRKGAKRR